MRIDVQRWFECITTEGSHAIEGLDVVLTTWFYFGVESWLTPDMDGPTGRGQRRPIWNIEPARNELGLG